MRFATIFAGLAAVTAVVATPLEARTWGGQDQYGWWPGQVLSQADATTIVNKFISLLQHTNIQAANATAQALLVDNYTEISDSILSLEGLPLGGVTFQGKQAYIAGLLGSPGIQGINTLEILVAGGTKILWYWNFTGVGSAQYPVKGFNLFTITSKKQIAQLNVEFNSIAWGLDTGYQLIFPPAQ